MLYCTIMKVKFFGVRGSHPVPNKKMMKYGGRTASVVFTKEVNGKTIPLFIDAGNGAIEAGKEFIPGILSGKCSGEFTMFFTHLHPDHTEGFTFFGPNYLPQVRIHLYGMYALKKNVGMVLRDKMMVPTFPIEYRDLRSDRKHGIVEEGDIWWIDEEGKPVKEGTDTESGVGKFIYKVDIMQSFAPAHPQQGCIYYRVTDVLENGLGKSVVCAWDIESRKGGDQRLINFSKGADVMIHDTQYTDEEYYSDKMIVQGFGHSTFSMGLENAELAGVKTLIPFHYNPAHTDEMLDKIFAGLKSKKVTVVPSAEGLTVEL